MADQSINLLRTKSLLSQSELSLLGKLRLFSSIGLMLIVVAGSVVAAIYLTATMTLNSLTNQIAVTKRKITLQSRKEVLLTTIKNRIPALQKNMSSQYPWDNIMSMVNEVAKAPQLEGVSINERNELTLSIRIDQLEELEAMLNVVSDFSTASKLKEPLLKGLQLDKKGKLVATIQFIPQF